jgi:geranylgeranyl pyrophosphate synthase
LVVIIIAVITFIFVSFLLLCFKALEKCHELGNPIAMNVFVRELLNLHKGQGQDILWRDNLTCPSQDEYNQMVLDKTGGLFRLAVGLMQAFSESSATIDFNPLVNKLALYFQVCVRVCVYVLLEASPLVDYRHSL